MLTKISLKSVLRASEISKSSGEMSSDAFFGYTNFQKPPFNNPRSATVTHAVMKIYTNFNQAITQGSQSQVYYTFTPPYLPSHGKFIVS